MRLPHLRIALFLKKTAAFIAAIRSLGCGSSESSEVPNLPPSEQEQRAFLEAHQSQIQRGYEPAIPKCPGRISLEYNYRGKAFVVCEFHSSNNRFHLYRILDDSYDLDYIEAFFNEDDDELQRIEEAACLLGYGPLATCKNITNFSSQRFHCPFDHRDAHGRLIQLPMCTLSCNTKFTLYEPLEQFRLACPYVLLVSKGDHPHPIPLPRKTPPQIKDDLLEVLKSLDGDLVDLTPRRFLRHPILQAYLRQKFPQLPNPTLSDLHSSLANREHLRVYIKNSQSVVRLKEWQDANLPAEDHYIRCILDLPDFPTDEFDTDPSSGPEPAKNLRLIVCMTPNGSRRLQQSQYLQSDIGFQRIEGFHEFEIAAMDSFANTSVIFLRIYLNRQTALAHKMVMDTVNNIVKIDTGSAIQWRHLHANSPNDTPNGMVLLWTAGPARRTSQSLSPYEHLHRVFRVCDVHGKRNIRKCAVPESVRKLMRSLICLRHPDWDATIASIRQLGGKAGEEDWVQDKIRSKFAFEGWCWEKSHIPESVWRAGQSHSNLVESVHADVNREGVRCTLLGGLKKGQSFDTQKMRTLKKSYDAWQKASKSQQIAAGILRGVNPNTQRDLHRTRLQEFTKAREACERAEGKYKKRSKLESL
ncbi:hypothetical protein B0H14DRAFT_2642118 [Mycena olivaceomarginata]|nr:hypothetical protein B0H14DRAFT_2642118 [Mycena olivaceomarginata]